MKVAAVLIGLAALCAVANARIYFKEQFNDGALRAL